MSDLPEPMVPQECDLRDFPFMPLEVQRLRRSKAWLAAKREPALAFYLINLWTAAWHDLPAASLEDDDEVLADLAMCEPRKWQAIKALALRGWVKCSDGRLYHPVVAEKARTAWASKIAQRDRTEAARKAKAEKKKQERLSGGGQPPDGAATETVTESVTDNVTKIVTRLATDTVTTSVTDIATETVTASKRERDLTKEGRKNQCYALDAEASLQPPPDVRQELWSEGLALIRGVTGKSDQQSRALLGKLVKAANDDCAGVLAALRAASDLRPVDPIPWLIRAVQPRTSTGSAFLDMIAEEGVPDQNPLEIPRITHVH